MKSKYCACLLLISFLSSAASSVYAHSIDAFLQEGGEIRINMKPNPKLTILDMSPGSTQFAAVNGENEDTRIVIAFDSGSEFLTGLIAHYSGEPKYIPGLNFTYRLDGGIPFLIQNVLTNKQDKLTIKKDASGNIVVSLNDVMVTAATFDKAMYKAIFKESGRRIYRAKQPSAQAFQEAVRLFGHEVILEAMGASNFFSDSDFGSLKKMIAREFIVYSRQVGTGTREKITIFDTLEFKKNSAKN